MASLDLPFDEVESIISEISIGGRIVSVPTFGAPKNIFVTHCTAEEKMYASAVYTQAYNRAVEEGFLTAEETSKALNIRGLYTLEDDAKIDDLRSKIDAQEKLLEKMTRVPARRERVKENIETLKGRLMELLGEKERYLEFSAERKAHEERLLFLCWRGVKDPLTKKLIWPTKEEFDNEKDAIFRRSAFTEHVRLSLGVDPTVLRYIARHNLWRIRYNVAVKTGASLFGVGLSDYSIDQLALSHWSYFYQSVYEMLPDEKPPEDIIEDDAALDAFMQSYMEEQSREAAAAKGKKANKSGVKPAWDYEETIVMGSNPLYKDIKYSPTIESARNKVSTDVKHKGRKVRQ